ncbi:MAG: hypothetical protein RL213_1804 [Bacteroidota bacterium]|jgi:hypothetical protein
MTKNHPVDDLVGHAKQYVEKRAELGKLQLVEKGSVLSGEFVARLTFAVVWVTVLTFLSVAAALYLGEIFGKNYLGFATVALAYALIGFLFYLNRDRWIKRPVAGGIIRSLLKEDHHD